MYRAKIIDLVKEVSERWKFDDNAIRIAKDLIFALDNVKKEDQKDELYYLKLVILCDTMAKAEAARVDPNDGSNNDDYGFVYWYVRNEVRTDAEEKLSKIGLAKFIGALLRLPMVIPITFRFIHKFDELIKNGEWRNHLSMELFVKPKLRKYFTDHWVNEALRERSCDTKIYKVLQSIMNEPINRRYIEEIIIDAHPRKISGTCRIKPDQNKIIIEWSNLRYDDNSRSAIDTFQTSIMIDISNQHEYVTSSIRIGFTLQHLPVVYSNAAFNQMIDDMRRGSLSRNDVIHLINLWDCHCALCKRLLILMPTHTNCFSKMTLSKWDKSKGMTIRNTIITCNCCEQCPTCYDSSLLPSSDSAEENESPEISENMNDVD